MFILIVFQNKTVKGFLTYKKPQRDKGKKRSINVWLNNKPTKEQGFSEYYIRKFPKREPRVALTLCSIK